jgi:HK97 family phage portal protein
MTWNDRSRKDFAPPAIEVKRVPVGGMSALNQGNARDSGGYKDGWDIERAYRDGMSKVTWLFRAVDAISSNQAKLPMMLRKDNLRDGEIVTDDPILELLNGDANNGENAFIFRYRISAQLLISTRGVFIEIIRDKRTGKPVALHLLPPQHTSPVPDVKNFVKSFEVAIPSQNKIYLKPKDVIWIRRPHPLDPYLSMTPMEAAGIAIEIEMLAKIYNRQFLLNDGRPGGLLVLRGDIDEEDKQELQSRFRGNLQRSGAVGVIASEEGADFLDTAASPRDAAYVQMRELTKEEILAAFGVPESIIGNASGRTFANAAEEGKVFWMETMSPHLEIIARPLSHLTPDHVVDYNTDEVPILVLAKQEQARFSLEEYRAGLISANEYRSSIGKKLIESELADSLLANPNLTPMGNTEKPTEVPDQAGAGSLADQSAEGAASVQDQVTQFDPESGQFGTGTGASGGSGSELPASQAPSEAGAGGTGGPVI